MLITSPVIPTLITEPALGAVSSKVDLAQFSLAIDIDGSETSTSKSFAIVARLDPHYSHEGVPHKTRLLAQTATLVRHAHTVDLGIQNPHTVAFLAALHALRRQPLKQGAGSLQIRGRETFGEPIINRCKRCSRLVLATLAHP
jgi:hypothetical protein